MPYATALAMLEGEPLVWAGQTALKFYGRTVVDETYNGLALDSAEGDRIAAAMGNADIAFMRNHGVLVIAPTIAEAWDDLYYLERAAQSQWLAESTGRRIQPVPTQVAQATARQMRQADRESAAPAPGEHQAGADARGAGLRQLKRQLRTVYPVCVAGSRRFVAPTLGSTARIRVADGVDRHAPGLGDARRRPALRQHGGDGCLRPGQP